MKHRSLTLSITDTPSSHHAATASQASTVAVGLGSTDLASSSHAEDVSLLQLFRNFHSSVTPDCKSLMARGCSLLSMHFWGKALQYIHIYHGCSRPTTRTREGSQGYIWVILNQQLEWLNGLRIRAVRNRKRDRILWALRGKRGS